MLRLRRMLDAKGIQMKGCAELLGVSEKTMYNKVVGDTEFTYGEVRRLKSILPEYDMDYLLTEESTYSGGAWWEVSSTELPGKDYFNITANVHVNGADEALSKLEKLKQEINEAKTLAGELASLIEKLEVKVEL